MKTSMCIGLALLSIFCVSIVSAAESMNGIFAEGMVLQQQMSAPIFGTATVGQKVTVTFRGDSVSGTADTQGKWLVKIPTKVAGGPFPLTIKGSATRTIQEVWVGEVWLAGGQSNINVGLDATQQAQVTDDNNIHLFVAAGGDATPRNWASVKAGQNYPQLCYFFAKELQKTRNVHIGIISAAKGATTMSNWLSYEAFSAADPKLTELPAPGYVGQCERAIIAPLRPYGIKGIIWQQGQFESDIGGVAASVPDLTLSFKKVFQALITEWRANWGQGNFPWIFVQMEQYFDNSIDSWAKVREAQRQVQLNVPNTGMATIVDAGCGLHPDFKWVHAARLAKIARATVYGEQIEYSGPIIQSVTRSGSSVVLTFSHANGLTAIPVTTFNYTWTDFSKRSDSASSIEVQAQGAGFVSVPATISGQTVVLNVGNMSDPLTIRYAFSNQPSPCNMLYNSDTLPASPFLLPNATGNATTAKTPASFGNREIMLHATVTNGAVAISGVPVNGTIRVTSLKGALVRELHASVNANAKWDLRDGLGGKIGRGMYLISGQGKRPITVRVF